ncbi:hypothetical protein [Microbacterium lacticum]|nr:hypothetical protein [Microbacterium lacticum]
MLKLDDGLNRIAQKYGSAVQFNYEDPVTFGAGHFVFYPVDNTRSRFAIEEQYTGTDWSDDERVPTSWTWVAEREVRDQNGAYIWGVEREGETRSKDVQTLLTEAEQWARRVQNRAAQREQFRAPVRNSHWGVTLLVDGRYQEGTTGRDVYESQEVH